ncbi:heavy-metal-associated domain-containing protein [Breznakia pachnodae]|uniref:Copper chaperone CopZ n=1 Tax=Breznakia pachnodae TaxID=265178 RepID=A0ABU0E4J5_9FIRM|nr:heavy-metal-associated domain-containing protein [Breznakia pachnodae]MDQ0361828.1 copper chaperone CopZ [Breznakia pachnodae]
MKHILIIKNMDCDHCVEKISEALTDAGIEFDINLEQKTVGILGRGDAVASATRIITGLGYQIA